MQEQITLVRNWAFEEAIHFNTLDNDLAYEYFCNQLDTVMLQGSLYFVYLGTILKYSKVATKLVVYLQNKI